jgi:hypothetical protein
MRIGARKTLPKHRRMKQSRKKTKLQLSKKKGEEEEQSRTIKNKINTVPDLSCCWRCSSAFFCSFSLAFLFFSFQAAKVSGVTLVPTPVSLAR